MPIYEYGCDCGARFERLVPRPETPTAPCPACGGVPRRRPSVFAPAGRADPGPGPEEAPRTWEQTHHGDRETILHWRRALERRAKLEERHPELARPRSPVLAHEGPYAAAPLRAGEPNLRRSPAEGGESPGQHPPSGRHPHPHGPAEGGESPGQHPPSGRHPHPHGPPAPGDPA